MEGITSPPMGQFSTGNIYSPLLISLLGIICTTFAILFYHFFLVRYCMNRHRDSQSSTTTSPPPQPPHTGIDKKILNSISILPFRTVKKRNAHVENHEECVVCLGDLEDDDLTRVLPNCKHAFHVECIDVWLNDNVTCPLCRSGITAEGKAPVYDVVLCSVEDTITTASVINDEELDRGTDGSDHHATAQSCGLLRHCASLVLTPAEGRRSRSVAGLKRSLSMDQSFIAIDLQSEGESSSVNRDDGLCSDAGGSASASVTGNEVTQSLNLNQLDRMSSRLLRSFSRLGIGKGNSATTLPY